MAAVTALLLRKCCPCSLPFISPNTWKSEGDKSGLRESGHTAGCGKDKIGNWVMALWSYKLLSSSGLTLAFSFVSVTVLQAELMICLSSRKSRGITPFLSQKTVLMAVPPEGCIFNFFFFRGEFTCHQSMECCFDSCS